MTKAITYDGVDLSITKDFETLNAIKQDMNDRFERGCLWYVPYLCPRDKTFREFLEKEFVSQGFPVVSLAGNFILAELFPAYKEMELELYILDRQTFKDKEWKRYPATEFVKSSR